jgi:homoserine kinase type II
VLSAYPADCRPTVVERVAAAEGFSGAGLWRLATPRGPACLRRWPAEHPSLERLQFIQAVLWHVDREGFRLVPVPWETKRHAGFVEVDGRFWELGPWLPGAPDYRERPSRARLTAALAALAGFHRAAESFPLPSDEPAVSPGIAQRAAKLAAWSGGKLDLLYSQLRTGRWPQLAALAEPLPHLFAAAAPRVRGLLVVAGEARVPLQAAIRDIWHRHVLFDGERVSGIVDFGAMRTESVAADVARLLGSMALDDTSAWSAGTAAYEAVRPLSDAERRLVQAFDASAVLMTSLEWLDWLVLEERQFDNMPAVMARIDESFGRLRHMVAAGA